MSVDYTTVFTLLGDIVQTSNTYFAFLSTFATDQAATEALLDAQNVNRFVDGLDAVYETFRNDVVGWTGSFIERANELLTDYTLVTSQFRFGSDPNVQDVWAALIQDMVVGTRSIKPSVGTVGSVTKASANADVGTVVITTKLDGVSSPISGAISSPYYAGVTSQLLPDAETITLTCVSDSETGTVQGGESFAVTGIGPASDPFSVLGGHLGNGGQISVADAGASGYATNPNFDSWDTTGPTGWTETDCVVDVDFEENTVDVIYGSGSSLRTLGSDQAVTLSQFLDPNIFVRGRAYMLSFWSKDLLTPGVQNFSVSIYHVPGGVPTTLVNLFAVNPDNDWHFYSGVFVIPFEIGGVLGMALGSSNESSGDQVFDNIVITPVEYLMGVGIAVFAGPDKFLVGDTLTFSLSNSNAGKFQTWIRKAYAVQLPTNASPTISDSLVT